MRTIIVDIDGTLAMRAGITDPREKRYGDEVTRSIHDYARVHEDNPIAVIIDLVHRYANDHHIVFLTGRPTSCADATRKWLQDHGLNPTLLFMRETGDKRKDYTIKEEIYHQYLEQSEIAFVLEDRQQCVDMWRSLGLVCLQVAPGNF